MAVLRDVFGAIYRLELKLPTQYLLLERAAATLEGIGTEFIRVSMYLSSRALIRGSSCGGAIRRRSIAARGGRELQTYVNMFRDFPEQLHDALEQVRQGEVKVNFVHRNLEGLLQRFTVLTNRLVVAIVCSSMILGSSIIGLFAQVGRRSSASPFSPWVVSSQPVSSVYG